MSDAPFGKAAVINRMVGLHGGNDVKLRKAVEVLGCHVLGVFDAETAVSFAMNFGGLGVEIENHRDCPVADGVGADLHSAGIGRHHAAAHQGERLHPVVEQTAIFPLIQERLIEVRRARTERAVGVSLDCSNAQIWTAKGPPNAEFRLVLDLSDKRRGINARGEFPAPQQF